MVDSRYQKMEVPFRIFFQEDKVHNVCSLFSSVTFRRLLTLSDFQDSLAVFQYLSSGLFLYYSVFCLYTFSDFSYHSVTARFAKHLKSVIFHNVTSKTTQSSGVCYDLTGPLTRKKVFAANKRLFSVARRVKMMHY